MSAWIYYIVGGLMILVAAAVGIVLLVNRRSRQGYAKGISGKVKKSLLSFGLIRKYKILEDVTLSVGKKKAHIDYILIGFFGLIVLQVQGRKGEIFGEARDKEWLHTRGEKFREHFANPIQTTAQTLDTVRTVFQQEKMYNIPLDGFCVFGNGCTLHTVNNPSIVTYKQFKKILHSYKYEVDNQIDIEKIKQALGAYTVGS